MTEGIIIAIIGAIGVVLAAAISSFKKSDNTDKKIKIKQKQGIANKGTQIGIQNNYGSCENIKGEEKNGLQIFNYRSHCNYRCCGCKKHQNCSAGKSCCC